MSNSALIVGCAGTPSPGRARLLPRRGPLGVHLFKRNVGSPDEVRALTDSLRETVGRADAPVLIDQEGGRVQRMGPPHWPAYPKGAAYRASAPDDEAVGRSRASAPGSSPTTSSRWDHRGLLCPSSTCTSKARTT
jgi:beta-N-acetylhexosaminidase